MPELDLDALMEDTKRTARIDDRAAHSMALAMIEVARQLKALNAMLDGSKKVGNGKKSEGKKKSKKK